MEITHLREPKIVRFYLTDVNASSLHVFLDNEVINFNNIPFEVYVAQLHKLHGANKERKRRGEVERPLPEMPETVRLDVYHFKGELFDGAQGTFHIYDSTDQKPFRPHKITLMFVGYEQETVSQLLVTAGCLVEELLPLLSQIINSAAAKYKGHFRRIDQTTTGKQKPGPKPHPETVLIGEIYVKYRPLVGEEEAKERAYRAWLEAKEFESSPKNRRNFEQRLRERLRRIGYE